MKKPYIKPCIQIIPVMLEYNLMATSSFDNKLTIDNTNPIDNDQALSKEYSNPWDIWEEEE